MASTITPFGSVKVGGDDAVFTANPFTGSAGVGVRDDGFSLGAGVKGGVPSINASISGAGGKGVGVTASPTGVTPTVNLVGGRGSAEGSTAGSIVGGIVAAPLGPVGMALGAAAVSAIGGVVGSVLGKESKARKEHTARDSVRNAFKDVGLFDQAYQFLLPDGTTANFRADGTEGTHSWFDARRRTDNVGNRQLHAYEIDYTNDMDYLSGMAGITLSRVLSGSKSKAVDQMGNQIGNQLLGKVGYGAVMNQDNFNTVTTNARALYSQGGIQSKEDLLTLANSLYASGEIDDSDYTVMQQTANIVYDNDFNTAQSLMGGRWGGVEAATKTKQNVPGRIHSPVISPEEALMSVNPYFQYYAQAYPDAVRSRDDSMSTAATIAETAGAIGSVAGIASKVDEWSGGALSGAWDGAKDALFGGADVGVDVPTPTTEDFQLTMPSPTDVGDFSLF